MDRQRHIMVVMDEQRHITRAMDNQRYIMVVMDQERNITRATGQHLGLMAVLLIVTHHITVLYVDRVVVYQEGPVLVHFAVAVLCHRLVVDVGGHVPCLLQVTRDMDHQHHLTAVTVGHNGAVSVHFAVFYPGLLVPVHRETTPRLLAAHVAENLCFVVGHFHDQMETTTLKIQLVAVV